MQGKGPSGSGREEVTSFSSCLDLSSSHAASWLAVAVVVAAPAALAHIPARRSKSSSWGLAHSLLSQLTDQSSHTTP